MPAPKQSDTTFEEMNQIIWKHLEERDWHNTVNARGLAVSLSLEANELLEHYQWSDKAIGDKEQLAAELADVIIYAFMFAQVHDIDIADAMREKLKKSALKYPAHKFKGKNKADQQAAWNDTKLNHRKKGL